jgi:hypothetical protein
MMQSCASAAGSLAAGPIYKSGTKARVGIGAPPPRIVKGAAPARPIDAERYPMKLLLVRLRGLWGPQAALSTTPAGTSPVVT